MNQIQTMRVFICVIEQQSFRRAARTLGVSNARVTRSIAALEGHLNTRLMHRTTRSLSLTEAGVRYLDGCRALLEAFDHLESSIVHATREPVGTLRVVASGRLSPRALTPLVDGFRRHHPQVRVQLTIADAPIDALDTCYDAGIVTGDRLDGHPALVGHALAPDTLVPCASPAYLARCGLPRRPGDLSQHAWIALAPHEPSSTWRMVDPDGVAHLVPMQPSYTVNRLSLVREAAVAGSGIALLPESFAADALDSGALVPVLAGYRADDPDARRTLVYPDRQFVPARTRSFVEYALAHFGRRAGRDDERHAPPDRTAPAERADTAPNLQ
ncbi:LysR family transcriptional regulator [Burkholderia guangdongensis]|uniref:LysR family transcriptional regulator n=1 Tax=Burkholderia guangdongensis TaxID=1792500 RepID=UPI0015CD08DD|nr:LysR family transcriptional regulator [Burkholderia guangdongensis]